MNIDSKPYNIPTTGDSDGYSDQRIPSAPSTGEKHSSTLYESKRKSLDNQPNDEDKMKAQADEWKNTPSRPTSANSNYSSPSKPKDVSLFSEAPSEVVFKSSLSLLSPPPAPSPGHLPSCPPPPPTISHNVEAPFSPPQPPPHEPYQQQTQYHPSPPYHQQYAPSPNEHLPTPARAHDGRHDPSYQQPRQEHPKSPQGQEQYHYRQPYHYTTNHYEANQGYGHSPRYSNYPSSYNSAHYHPPSQHQRYNSGYGTQPNPYGGYQYSSQYNYHHPQDPYSHSNPYSSNTPYHQDRRYESGKSYQHNYNQPSQFPPSPNNVPQRDTGADFQNEPFRLSVHGTAECADKWRKEEHCQWNNDYENNPWSRKNDSPDTDNWNKVRRSHEDDGYKCRPETSRSRNALALRSQGESPKEKGGGWHNTQADIFEPSFRQSRSKLDEELDALNDYAEEDRDLAISYLRKKKEFERRENFPFVPMAHDLVDIPPKKGEWMNPFYFARKLLGERFLNPADDHSVAACEHCGDQHNPKLCAHAPSREEELFEDDLTSFYDKWMVGWDKKEKEEKSLPEKDPASEPNARLFNLYTEEKPSDPSDPDEGEESTLECDSQAIKLTA